MSRILETGRLYLREFKKSDSAKLKEIYSDTDVMHYIGTGVTISDSARIERSISRWMEYAFEFGFSNWAVILKVNDLMIGKCGFSWLEDNSDIEISYLFEKQYWGKGFATEIASATLSYGFDKLGLKRIVAIVYPQNISSIRVIEKLGMNFERKAIFFEKELLLYSSER